MDDTKLLHPSTKKPLEFNLYYIESNRIRNLKRYCRSNKNSNTTVISNYLSLLTKTLNEYKNPNVSNDVEILLPERFTFGYENIKEIIEDEFFTNSQVFKTNSNSEPIIDIDTHYKMYDIFVNIFKDYDNFLLALQAETKKVQPSYNKLIKQYNLVESQINYEVIHRELPTQELNKLEKELNAISYETENHLIHTYKSIKQNFDLTKPAILYEKLGPIGTWEFIENNFNNTFINNEKFVAFLTKGYLVKHDGTEGAIDKALTFDSIESLAQEIQEMSANYGWKNRAKYSVMQVTTKLTKIIKTVDAKMENNNLNNSLVPEVVSQFEKETFEKNINTLPNKFVSKLKI